MAPKKASSSPKKASSSPKKSAKRGKMPRGGERKRKHIKDPGAPKRALSAYIMFAKDMRNKFVSENPALGSDLPALGKLIGAEWRKLSAKDRLPYEKMSDCDKVRYAKEKALYEKKK